MSTHLSASSLKTALEEAVKQRDIKYKIVFAISFSFAGDDTQAQHDTESFIKHCKDLFGIASPDIAKFQIPDDENPHLYFKDNICNLVYKTHGSIPGRKLLLLHYAGHGRLTTAGDLELCAKATEDSQYLSWDSVDCDLLRPNISGIRTFLADLDVLCVVDCCHSGRASRASMPIGRTVEVIAAADEKSVTNSRADQPTFTQRFLTELRRQVEMGDVSITVARIHTATTARHSGRSEPIHSLLVGDTPILLPVKTMKRPKLSSTPGSSVLTSQSIAESRWAPPQYSAVIRVHSQGQITDESTRTLVDWLMSLPNEYGLEISSIHSSHSTVIFLTVGYEHKFALLRLNAIEGLEVDVMYETFLSRNLLSLFTGSSQEFAQGTSVSAGSV
ncbi:hypothetical protein ABW19_dt0201380 [Dactylella cylindrospora]|nr:hypothetical protein ABW19_dt0201380 [Dactylella cylindrospora]